MDAPIVKIIFVAMEVVATDIVVTEYVVKKAAATAFAVPAIKFAPTPELADVRSILPGMKRRELAAVPMAIF